MRATIETHENSNNLPPIQVMVSLGGEDMSIKVGCKLQLHEMPILEYGNCTEGTPWLLVSQSSLQLLWC